MHKGKAVGSRKPRNAMQVTIDLQKYGFVWIKPLPQPTTQARNQTPNAMSPTLHCDLFGESAQTGLVRHHPIGWRQNPSSWTCSRSYERSLKLRCNEASGLRWCCCVTVTRHKKSTVNGKPKNPRRNLFGRVPSSKFGEWRQRGRATCAIRNSPLLNKAKQTKNQTNERRKETKHNKTKQNETTNTHMNQEKRRLTKTPRVQPPGLDWAWSVYEATSMRVMVSMLSPSHIPPSGHRKVGCKNCTTVPKGGRLGTWWNLMYTMLTDKASFFRPSWLAGFLGSFLQFLPSLLTSFLPSFLPSVRSFPACFLPSSLSSLWRKEKNCRHSQGESWMP